MSLQLVTGYPFASGELNITHTKLNLAVNAATAVAGSIATADLADDLITKDKVNSNVAGAGLQQNADGSLEVVGAGNLTTILAAANKTLTRGTSKQTQKYTGTLSGPVVIDIVRTNAIEGDKFRIVLDVVVDNTNTLTIRENSSGTLIAFTDATFVKVKGTIDFEYMIGSTSWEIVMTNVTESA